MIIYFAGLSGIDNRERLKMWIRGGVKNKLISYYELMTGDGVREFDYLIENNQEAKK